MKTWVRKSLKVGVLSAGIILFAGGTAQANDWSAADSSESGNRVEAMETGDNDGIGTGNQIDIPVEIPILICGNSVGVLSDAHSACVVGGQGGGDGDYESTEAGNWETGDNGGVLSGNQILADIDVPILACGNAIGVAGDTAAACKVDGMGHRGGDREHLGAWETGDNDGLLTGNQIAAILDVPILVCGNAVGILGDSAAACSIDGHDGDDNGHDGNGDGGGDGDDNGHDGDDDGNGNGDGGGDGDDDGNGDGDGGGDGDGDGNGDYPNGNGAGGGDGDDDGNGDGGGDGDGDGDGGVAGEPYGEPARSGAEQLPVFDSLFGLDKVTKVLPLGGNLGGAESARHAETGDNGSGWRTGDNQGILSGNQALVDVDIPIKVVGNGISVLGGDAVGVAR